MALENAIAALLLHDPVGRITFKVGPIAINRVAMEPVAEAIANKDITIESGSTGDRLGAAYSSFVSRVWKAGEKPIIGKITVGGEAVIRSAVGKAGVFHECVHALKDVQGPKGPMYKISMHHEEVVAYLADAMYLRATSASIAGDANVMAIYDAAFALVDGRKMLKRHGVRVTWADCDGLLRAIKAHPAY